MHFNVGSKLKVGNDKCTLNAYVIYNDLLYAFVLHMKNMGASMQKITVINELQYVPKRYSKKGQLVLFF